MVLELGLILDKLSFCFPGLKVVRVLEVVAICKSIMYLGSLAVDFHFGITPRIETLHK